MAEEKLEKKCYFLDSFALGKKFSKLRINLAIKYDCEEITGKEPDIQEYNNFRRQFDENTASGVKQGLAGILGYACSAYTAFFPLKQLILNEFDSKIYDLNQDFCAKSSS
jgi:hypothetical protein